MHSSPVSVIMRYQVTVHTSLSREVCWHEYAKIPRHMNFGYVTVNGVNTNVELRELRSSGAIRRYRRK